MKNKKGNLTMEMVGAFIFLIVCVLIGVLVLFVLGEFNSEWQAADAVTETSKTELASYNSLTVLVLDGAFIFYLALLWIATLVSAYFLDNTPIYFVIFFIFALISFFILIPIANVLIDMENSPLSTYFDKMPMSMFVINNMAIFMVAFIATTGVALYAKFNGGAGLSY